MHTCMCVARANEVHGLVHLAPECVYKQVKFDLVTARANYAAHLQWRRVTSPDVLDPRSAAAIAKVPRWIWFEGEAGDGGVGSNDTRTVWVQGAMFDSDAASADDYVLATTRVLDENLDRASEERTVVTLSTHPHGTHPQTRKHMGVRARSLSHTHKHTHVGGPSRHRGICWHEESACNTRPAVCKKSGIRAQQALSWQAD